MTDIAFYGLGAVVLLGGVLAAPRLPDAGPAIERALASRWAPVAVGAVAFFLFLYTWGSANATAVFHDESAYLLQARIFARGRWASPAPPLPEFFEQFHVFVTPKLASKYPPGHSLLMVPGVWLGLPGLVPLLLNALSAALLYVLARRLAGAAVALLAVAVWVTSAGVHLHLSSYFSETTTVALWLAGWYVLLRWRETRRPWLLAALSAMVAWGGITRPLTMVVFALPVAVVVLRDVVRTRLWRQLAGAAAVGVAVCGIVPLWSARTLGNWRTNPYPEYSRIYTPADRPGFGPDTTRPLRPLAPDQAQFLRLARERRAAYVPAVIPRTYVARMRMLWTQFFYGWRGWLALVALLGLASAPVPVWVALGTSVLLTLAYLLFPHDVVWTLYYAEGLPVVACLTALGAWRLIGLFASRKKTGDVDGKADAQPTVPSVDAEPSVPPDDAERSVSAAASGDAGRPVAGPARLIPATGAAWVIAAAAALGLALASAPHLRQTRNMHQAQMRYFEYVDALVGTIPDPKAVVFIRYAPTHFIHWSLIRNEPDPATARIWRVYDRGADDRRLMRAAPDRVPYLFDEATGRLYRIPR